MSSSFSTDVGGIPLDRIHSRKVVFIAMCVVVVLLSGAYAAGATGWSRPFSLELPLWSSPGWSSPGWSSPGETTVPSVTLGPKSSLVGYRQLKILKGWVWAAVTHPISGAQVVLQSSSNGKTFSTGGPVTTSSAVNGFSFGVAPSAKTWYRARVLPAPFLAQSFSPVVTVTPKAYLTRPSASRYGTRAYKLYGTLKPRHASGTYAVRIYRWRYTGGRWRAYSYVRAKVVDYSGNSRYQIKHRFPYKGRWRLRAYHSDSRHRATNSSYSYVTVR